jgi:ferredoxin
MRVRVEEERCCGFASCISLAETVFDIGDDNIAHVIDDAPGEALWAAVRAAAESCPTDAIVVEE